jgi:hypothetical protein
MTFRDDINRLLAHPVIDAYVFFCACVFLGGMLIFVAGVAFLCVRIWMKLPPIPPGTPPFAELWVMGGAIVVNVMIATLLTVRRYRSRNANRRDPL